MRLKPRGGVAISDGQVPGYKSWPLTESYIRVCRQCSEPDWAHAPLPFKFYRDCPLIPLSSATLEALSLDGDRSPTLSLGLLLHDIYGIIRVIIRPEEDVHSMPEDKPFAMASAARPYNLFLGRTVASGGARFPGELYLLVGAGQALVAGLYHYDPAHHALNLLRASDLTDALLDGLAQPPESQPDFILLFSTLFWKNAFKYQEFSYRLQGLDLGCLLAQAQLVAEHHNLEPTLHFRFLDIRINQLLGLDPMEESVYAIVTLQAASAQVTPRHAPQDTPELISRAELPGTLERYEPLSRWPLLEAVHSASHMQAQTDLCGTGASSPLARPAASDLVFELPSVTYRHERVDAVRRRSSQPLQFRPRPLTLQQLALLLQTGHRGHRGDLDGEAPGLAHTLLYCVINHVEGIPPGIYLYHAERHLLQQVRSGEFHQSLQATQAGPWVNATNLSLCVIPVGNFAVGFSVYGDRWYRIQNMEAGMTVQRIYLAVAASGLGCRASLSYRDESADALLRLPEGYTSLIQIFVSPLDSAVYDHGVHEQPLLW